VSVGVEWEDRPADEVLDEAQRPSRGGVVGVGDPAQTEWGLDGGVGPDDRGADLVDQVAHPTQANGRSGVTSPPGAAPPRARRRSEGARLPSMADVYTHGHHDSVLRSHRWRTVANSAAYLAPRL